MRNMKCWLLVLCLIMLCCSVSALAETTTINVSTEANLLAAITTINEASTGEYVISLNDDITINTSLIFSSSAVKTILGNGHFIKCADSFNEAMIYLDAGLLNLGDGSDNTLYLKGPGSSHVSTDSGSLIHVIATSTNTASMHPVMNIYAGTTIEDYYTDNTIGSAIRIYTNERVKTLCSEVNMYGGVIQNCGTLSGSNQFGGAVGVSDNGVFNMYGGVIRDCDAIYGGAVCMKLQSYGSGRVNDPVMLLQGGEISGNTSRIGGGIAVYDGTLTFNSGVVKENTGSTNGGGIYVCAGSSNNYTGSLVMNGGSVVDNSTSGRGGGIYMTGGSSDTTAHPLIINGGSVTGNNASTYGGGIYVQQSDVSITNASITENNVVSAGGGICTLYGNFTLGAGSVLCNNMADGAAADYFGYAMSNMSLTSALGMNQTYHDTGYGIDGWYDDDERWVYEYAFPDGGGTNVRYGDTFNVSDDSYALIAAFEYRDTSIDMHDGKFEVTIKGGEKVSFEPIPADTLYQVYEYTPNGWILLAQKDTTGVIKPLTESMALFVNKYQPDVATILFTARKLFDEQPAKENSFEFELWEDDVLLQTKAVLEGGFVQFDVLEYGNADAGTHHYTIKEKAEIDDTIIYDGHEEHIDVEVTAEDIEGVNHVNATVSYSDGTYPDMMFQNWTKPGDLSLQKLVDDLLDGHESDEFKFRIVFKQENGLPLGDDLTYWIIEP